MRNTLIAKSITIFIIVFLVSTSATSSVFALNNNYVYNELRIDSPEIYSAQDYKVQIAADALPNNTGSTTFTAGWLGIRLGTTGECNQSTYYCLTQVGLLTREDGIHWFAYYGVAGGITCYHGGTSFFNGKGCLGPLGDIVTLGSFHTVELAGYSTHWIARVYDVNGIAYDVARFSKNSTRIYRATVDFEEAWVTGPDPQLLGSFFFYHPQYLSGNNFLEWPQTNLPPSMDQSNRGMAWDQNGHNTICPSPYAFLMNYYGDSRMWWAGSGGQVCDWWFFPPVAGIGTTDNPATNLIFYDKTFDGSLIPGNWTHHSGTGKSYNQTRSWSNTPGDTVTFSFTGSRITRVYTMAYNRGQEDVYIDGYWQGQQSDYASTIRWQVGKTWSFDYGTHTIEVRNYGNGFIDLDAFIVDIPYVGSGSYDDPHSNFKYIGNWTHHCCTGNSYNLTRSWSRDPEDAVTFTFYGNSITYVFTKAPNRGKAVITIDGIHKEFLDLYADPIQWQVPKTYSNLGAGYHTIHISVCNCKNGAATDYFVDVDRFIVP
ncbi:MAG: hypothetical protein HUU38_29480 [Anaerolineales bacterium]|nr:hypothetical protein [Anaerolineales bacterium]